MLETDPSETILDIRDLTVEMQTRRGKIHAVDGVTLQVKKGRALGLVGESGSGKSVTCLAAIGALPKRTSRVVSGSITFKGRNLIGMKASELRKILGVEMSLVLQDPFSSLNPVFSIGDQVSDSIYYHRLSPRKSMWSRVLELLTAVRIPEPERIARSFPFELSGGMRQRVVIASSLAGPPQFLIADEATSSLDVTVQAQIIALLSDLRARLGMSMLVVTHDFGVVANLCDDVAVMYCGEVVETGIAARVLENPRHPYTKALLDAVPHVESKKDKLNAIPGSPPDRRNLPEGCKFAPRCSSAMPRCHHEIPGPTHLSPTEVVRCHLYDGVLQ